MSDYFTYKFIFYYYFFKLLEHSKYLIIFPNFIIIYNLYYIIIKFINFFYIFCVVKFRKLYLFAYKKITVFLNFTISF